MPQDLIERLPNNVDDDAGSDVPLDRAANLPLVIFLPQVLPLPQLMFLWQLPLHPMRLRYVCRNCFRKRAHTIGRDKTGWRTSVLYNARAQMVLQQLHLETLPLMALVLSYPFFNQSDVESHLITFENIAQTNVGLQNAMQLILLSILCGKALKALILLIMGN